jgi:hypothetical protein
MQVDLCIQISFDVPTINCKINVLVYKHEIKLMSTLVAKILSNSDEPISLDKTITVRFSSNSCYNLSPFTFSAIVKSDRVFKNELVKQGNFTALKLGSFFSNINLISKVYYRQVLLQIFCTDANRGETEIWKVIKEINPNTRKENNYSKFYQIILEHCEEERAKVTVLRSFIPVNALVSIVEEYTPLFKTIPEEVEDAFKKNIAKER